MPARAPLFPTLAATRRLAWRGQPGRAADQHLHPWPGATGDNVMIGGFIVDGDAPQTVLIRARGPSLSACGVPGELANPLMDVYSGQTVIASNDNWGTAPNAADITAAGLAPTDPMETAILTTLAPSAYTVIVRGFSNTSGVGIVEVLAQ